MVECEESVHRGGGDRIHQMEIDSGDFSIKSLYKALEPRPSAFCPMYHV